MSEHDFEPVRGLPGDLPKGETLLWQGAPAWWALAQRAFHMRTVALYFGLLMAWRFGSEMANGADAGAAVNAALGVAPVAVAALVLLALLALLTARTTVYTITSRRVVLRFGFAIPKAINLPFAILESADIRTYSDGSGDLSVTLTQPNKVAYLLLWPHARPWKLARPQPSMRAVPNAAAVAAQLSAALQSASARRGAAPAITPDLTPVIPPAPDLTPHGGLTAA